jgi:uncharacterized protein (DUF1697 family)
MKADELRMKYVALLRGINVGGKNAIRMPALKDCLERQAFESVATYIQSGNVVFDTDEKRAAPLARRIEQALSSTFGFDVPIVLQSYAQLKAIVDEAPRRWKRGGDLRRNIAFLRRPLTSTQAIKDVEVREGVDTVTAGSDVLYMSTVMSAVGKSRLNRLVTKEIYRDMTIRSYNTCLKILALMA